MQKKVNKRALGTEKEQVAAAFLEQAGYQILQMNYRCKTGEVDLIARHDVYLVFVEVKYRKNDRSGSPEESVTPAKQRKISKVCAWYLRENHLSLDTPCRFDVVAVRPEEVRIYQNAFPYRG
ncbi:MAG: YraN family protein [Oliverpabstia sp.]